MNIKLTLEQYQAQNDAIAEMVLKGMGNGDIGRRLEHPLTPKQVSARISKMPHLENAKRVRSNDKVLVQRLQGRRDSDRQYNALALATQSRFKALPGTKPISLIDHHEGQCKWPIDSVGLKIGLVCGCSAVIGRPYCTAHMEMHAAESAAGGRSRFTARISAENANA